MTGCMNWEEGACERSALQLVDESSLPLYEQIAGWMRSWIISGAIAPGTRIPSVRQLSRHSKVAIATIRHAIDLLAAEGWLVSKRGSGTFVSDSIAEKAQWINEGSTAPSENSQLPFSEKSDPDMMSGLTSAWGRRINQSLDEIDLHDDRDHALEIDFRVGAPVADLFTDPQWTDSMLRFAKEAVLKVKNFHDPQGMLELREQIAKWLNTHRGMSISADSVVIVNGAQQARNIIARLLIARGSRVGLEEPGSVFARTMFKSSGADLVPIAVDESGLNLEELERARAVTVLYTTPSAQFPTGAVLANSRRKRIADWANEREAIVIEDDNHSELIYDSRPAPAIFSLNPERTIYFGSFSQFLLPSWRLGYLVVPAQLRQPVLRLKWLSDRGTAPIVQQIALELFETGYFQRHLKKVQRMCSERRKILLAQLESLSPSGCRYTPVKGGLHQTLWLPPTMDDIDIFTRCFAAGVGLLPVSPHFLAAPKSPGLLLNFSALTAEQIEQGIWRIRKIIEGQYGA